MLSLADQEALEEWSDAEREKVFDVVMDALPSYASGYIGSVGDWCQGNTCDSITQIYQRDLFMNEAYVHGFSNLLQQEIIVVDVREKQLMIVCYEPGYGTQEQISMRSACKKREEQVKCLWLLLTRGHFSALLPTV